ncbi:MAG: TetR/AcrR family transcriptional regulator [Bacteroidetes bacterium]|nr:TetR/AcrR family transcriptional regulator [Bacteroidota bacterium]
MARTKEFDTCEVLDKAINLFGDKGYNGCSMQDIVDGLGLSRSSIYETFGDKRQLFLEALKKYQREGMDALEKNVSTASDFRQVLVQMFDSILAENLDGPTQKGCFLVNSTVELASHDPEIAAIVRANQQEMENIFYKGIKKGQQSGQITSSLHARSLARFFFSCFSGIRITARSGADRKTLEDIIKVSLSVL